MKLNLFIVGAAKCGTTFLNNLLRRHPKIQGIRGELHYFDLHYDDKLYISRSFKMDRQYKIFLDSSPFYAIHEKVPQRIYSYNEASKIIFCVRNREERILSHINMEREREIEKRGIKRIIDAELRSIDEVVVKYNRRLYVKRSLYYPQLKRFVDLFGRERVFVFNLDNHRLSDLYNFIGVEELDCDLDTIFKRKGVPKKPTEIEFLKNNKSLQRLIDRDKDLLKDNYNLVI